MDLGYVLRRAWEVTWRNKVLWLFSFLVSLGMVGRRVGIASGGRTGLTSITTGLLFLLSIIFVPILAIVPKYATAPALMMVGFYMMKNIINIDFKKLEIGFPSFLIIIMIAMSYSISKGLAFGFISYTLIKLFMGKLKEIKPALWIVTVLCLLFFIV